MNYLSEGEFNLMINLLNKKLNIIMTILITSPCRKSLYIKEY